MGLRGYSNRTHFPDVLSGQECTLRERAKTRERRPTCPVVGLEAPLALAAAALDKTGFVRHRKG
jgi:hypothetical protein